MCLGNDRGLTEVLCVSKYDSAEDSNGRQKLDDGKFPHWIPWTFRADCVTTYQHHVVQDIVQYLCCELIFQRLLCTMAFVTRPSFFQHFWGLMLPRFLIWNSLDVLNNFNNDGTEHAGCRDLKNKGNPRGSPRLLRCTLIFSFLPDIAPVFGEPEGFDWKITLLLAYLPIQSPRKTQEMSASWSVLDAGSCNCGIGINGRSEHATARHRPLNGMNSSSPIQVFFLWLDLSSYMVTAIPMLFCKFKLRHNTTVPIKGSNCCRRNFKEIVGSGFPCQNAAAHADSANED